MSVRQFEQESANEVSFDSLMASLLVSITHYNLSACDNALHNIVDRIERLCRHAEIEFYPDQQRILCKLNQLWQYKVFQRDYCSAKVR